jgi:hypothetical protein
MTPDAAGSDMLSVYDELNIGFVFRIISGDILCTVTLRESEMCFLTALEIVLR